MRAPFRLANHHLSKEETMAVARVTKLSSASSQGFDDAVRAGIERANRTLRGITGLQITEMKAKVDNGHISEFRVSMEVTFVLED
jgi:dodecin